MPEAADLRERLGGAASGRAELLRSPENPDGLLAPWSAWWPREAADAILGGHADVLAADEARVPLIC